MDPGGSFPSVAGWRHGTIGLALPILLLGACAGNRAPPGPLTEDPLQVAGCYTLTVDAEDWRVPEVVALDTVRLTTWPNLTRQYGTPFAVRSFETADGPAQDHPFGFWAVTAADSVFVGHPGALAGMFMRVGAAVEGSLAGVITSFTDVMTEGRPQQVDAAVRLRPVACG